MSWNIDRAHSSVSFSIRHLMFAKVHGRFTDFEGAVETDNEAPVKVTASIAVASIDTAEKDRDNHLRSPDFFDAERYPTMTFASTNVVKTGAGTYALTGDLTLHGVTRAVTLDVTSEGQAKDPWGNTRVAFEGRTRLNRKDFGLTWNQALETGGILVGEDVDVTLEIQAVKA